MPAGVVSSSQIRSPVTTPNSSSVSTIFGLSKDFSITAATVGTDAAMLPRPQQGLPAVAAPPSRRRVPVLTTVWQVSKTRGSVNTQSNSIPRLGSIQEKIRSGDPVPTN